MHSEIQYKPNEIFRDIKGYKGLYKVSNYGRVMSVGRVISSSGEYGTKHRVLKPRILTQTLDSDGYDVVCLAKNGTKKYKLVHQLVGIAFLPNPRHDKYINHKREDEKDNNTVGNLEWCNIRYNDNYGTRNYRIAKHSKFHRGMPMMLIGHGSFHVFPSASKAAKYIVKFYGGSFHSVSARLSSIASNRDKRLSTEGFIAKWYIGSPYLEIEKGFAKQQIRLYHHRKYQIAHKRQFSVELSNGLVTKDFDVTNDAAKWILKNNYANCKLVTVRNSINAVCKGRRKHCYGFTAKYIK